MDDHASRPSSSSMVVAEKNAHRPGGCVGIFIKLFQWNRRFAKKNLFPKKLLAPGENLPKSKHLLARNLNGKPGNLHSELKQPMRSPSLVARLMGLESIPVADSHCPFSENQYSNKTKQGTRHEIQPHKSRKSQRAVSRIGADALQIRNVLSRSRKRNPKLSSPVKSPRAAKSTSKLMGAATRILEPRLQAASRAKCALTYPNSIPKPMDDDVVRETKTVIRLPVQLGCNVVNQTTCRNCGHSVEAMDMKSPRIIPLAQVAGRSECMHPYHQTESPGGCFYRSPTLDLQAQGNVICRAHHQPPVISNGMFFSPDLVRNSVVHGQRCASSSAHSHPPVVRKNSTDTAFIDRREFMAPNRDVSQPCVGSPRKPCNCGEVLSGSRRSFSGKTAYPGCVRSRPVDLGMDQCSLGRENRDALGTMLEQKLKELTSQAEYELATAAGGRTTALILQELVSALTAEKPIAPYLNQTLSLDSAVTDGSSQKIGVSHSIGSHVSISQTEGLIGHNHLSSWDRGMAEAGAKSLSMKLCGDRFSPGSVLDAAFSNDSCISSSIDDGLDPLETTSLVNNRETSSNAVPVTHLLNHISRILDRIYIAPTANSGHEKEVLLNAELLFGKADGHSQGFVDFLLGPFLDELETLAVAAWRSTIVHGIHVSNTETDHSPIRRFLLDCLVECLSARYNRYINCGFRTWCELPRPTDTEALIRVFDSEVRKWASMARRSPYEIIDLEMSTSVGKWTDFEIEEFEAGGEIGQIIFQGLLEEITADFLS